MAFTFSKVYPRLCVRLKRGQLLLSESLATQDSLIKSSGRAFGAG